MEGVTPRRIFREAALRRHLQRSGEIHFPKLVAPATLVFAWMFIAAIGIIAACGAWISVPEVAQGRAFAADRDGRAGWTIAVEQSGRLQPGQTVTIGGAQRCTGQVDRVLASEAACAGSNSRWIELRNPQACEHLGRADPQPVRIELGQRRLASMLPVLRNFVRGPEG